MLYSMRHIPVKVLDISIYIYMASYLEISQSLENRDGALYFQWQPSVPWPWRQTSSAYLQWEPGHQRVEEPPRLTSAELKRKLFQSLDEEQCTKNGSSMHTNPHAKLPIVLTIDSYKTLGIEVHAPNDIHNPFLYTEAPQGPSRDLSCHTIEDFLNVNKGKVEWFVASDVLLQLKECVHSSPFIAFFWFGSDRLNPYLRDYLTDTEAIMSHDDVIKWKHFPHYWPFVRGIHRSPVNSLTKASDAGLLCILWFAPE